MASKRYRTRTSGIHPFTSMARRWDSIWTNTSHICIQITEKVRRLAIKSALSSKVQENNIVVLEDLVLEAPKTKEMAGILKGLSVDRKALIVTGDENENVILSARNIPGVTVVTANGINVLDVLNHDKLVITKAAVEKVEEVLG